MNKREYVAVTQAAVEALVRERSFSSFEFEGAEELVKLFSGEAGASISSKEIVVVEAEDGVVLRDRREALAQGKNSLVIDLEKVNLGELGGPLGLVALQKLLRFCIKYWNKYPLNNNEYLPPGSSKAIVFPFPINTGSSYRLVIERDPDKKRMASRQGGSHLLAYKFADNEGDGVKEETPVASFRKAVVSVFARETYLQAKESIESSGAAFNVAQLDHSDWRGGFVDPVNWAESLTAKQLAFVRADYRVPARIEGPAGSGKTLCVVLKAIVSARAAVERGEPFKGLFIAPSNEMVRNIQGLFDVYCPEQFHLFSDSQVFIKVATLQEVCSSHLGEDIQEGEFLDSDSQEAKSTQLLYLADIAEEAAKNIDAHRQFLSPALAALFREDDYLKIAELLKHEISSVIKGRSNENIESYTTARRPQYGLPVSTDNDRRFVFSLFQKYVAALDSLGQFDVDDVVLSVMGKLDSPIWRRRRVFQGYDAIFIDEVHLFNLNELSTVHYMTKDSSSAPITYAIDVSQALGDIAWDDADVAEVVGSDKSPTRLESVFRCSPEITNLAFSVTSHGASLFTNFHNPLSSTSAVTIGDEKGESEMPRYFLIAEGVDVVDFAFFDAEAIRSKGLKRSDVLMVFFDRRLLELAAEKAGRTKKSVEVITKRGDVEAVELARRKNSFLLALADHVGGLEFEASILVGVDVGRVPSTENVTSVASRQFQSYIAHNRVYVAVTRARSVVHVIGEAVRGPSEVFAVARQTKRMLVENNVSH